MTAGTSSFPAGLVTFLDGPLSNMPQRWEEYLPAQGRLLLATADPSQVRLSKGTPLAAGQVPMHSHTLTGSAMLFAYGTSSVGGGNQNVGSSGPQPATGSFDAAPLGLGFIHWPVVRSLGSGTPGDDGDPLPYGTLAFFDQAPPASHWTVRTDLSGHFVMPSMGSTTITGQPWNPATPPGHEHTASGTFTLTPKGFTWGGGANGGAAACTDARLEATAMGNPEPVVPYVALLLCEKTGPATPGTIPSGLTFFIAAQVPPDGWDYVPDSPRRFVVGLPAGGQPGFTSGEAVGATASHTHTVEAQVTVANFDTDLASLIQDFSLGQEGTYPVACECEWQQVSLPVVTALHCHYVGGNPTV